MAADSMVPATQGSSAPIQQPLAAGQVQALDTPIANVPVAYVNAFTPGQPNSLTTDPGVVRVVDPLGNQVQVPVVSQTIAVQKTAPGVYIAIGAIALYLMFKKGS